MGQKPKTLVEINGQKYDAITGQPMSNAAAPKPDTVPGQTVQPSTTDNAGSMSGVIAPARPHSKQVHSGQRAGHALHRSISPPEAIDDHQTKDQSVYEQPNPARRNLAQTIDPARLKRSSRHVKSSAIAKFSSPSRAATVPQPDLPPPLPANQPLTSPAISPKEQLIAKQIARAATSQAPTPGTASFNERLMSKLKNGRTGSVVASSLAALLLIGYVTYLNIPRMALRVAAGRAGFAAEIPGYAPSGFRFSGPVAYSPGELSLRYASNTDGREYVLKEKTTTWDSQTLLDNYVATESELYSTYQQRGLTIYVFDGSTATWVNGGIWFTIEGDSQLTSEQLLKIAASL